MCEREEKNPEKLMQELENATDKFRHDRYKMLLNVSKMFKEKGDTSSAEQINFESAAFSMQTHIPEKIFPGYFQPLFIYPNGIAIPASEFFTDEVLKHLEKRALSTKNPIISSRFSDIVWDLSKKNIKMAEKAIEEYIKIAEIYKKNLWGIEYSTAISRAIQLASMIKNPDYLSKVKGFCLKQLAILSKEKDFRYCIDIIKALGNSKIILNKEQNFIIKIIKKGIEYYEDKHEKDQNKLGPSAGPNEHLAHTFNDALIFLHKMKKIKININEIKKKNAESIEKQGDAFFEKKNFIGSILQYTKAEKIYVDIGLTQKIKELRNKIQKAGIKSYENMNQITVKQTMNNSLFESYIKRLLADNIKESLKLISASSHFVPKTKNVEEFLDEINRDFPLQAIIPRISVEEEGVVHVLTADEKLKEETIIRNKVLEIKIGNIFLHQLFVKLKNEQELDADTLLNHFKKWGHCSPINIEILHHGIKYYFKGDYISAIHLLIFQFEDLLRNLLNDAGFPKITPEKYSILRSLLNNENLKSSGGDDLIEYYKISLIEPLGLNLRNKIAHGLMPIRDMNELTAVRIIHLLLTLTRFKIEEKKT